jgi:hypothetical protein
MKITDSRSPEQSKGDFWKMGDVRLIDGDPCIMAAVSGYEYAPVSLQDGNRYIDPMISYSYGLYVADIKEQILGTEISPPLTVELIIL